MKTSSIKRRNWAGIALACFGLTAMIGDLLDCFPVKGIGAISCVAPFPKVFCEMDGVEGFASAFELEAELASGESVRIPLTPECYAGLSGPYNRRNVYGAALAGGPFLPETLWRPVYDYGLRADGPLRRELKLPETTEQIHIHIETKTNGRDDRWHFTSK